MEYVILVDENDEPEGICEKLEAHQQGLLHRAFSVIITDSQGRWLLQRRALDKYHCGGLWTNTCCSHPRPEEDTLAAAHRRLQEEMGMTAELKALQPLIYLAKFENGLIENEYDHIFWGHTDQLPIINPDEVMEYAYRTVAEIEADLALHPKNYTPWFRMLFNRLKKVS